MTDIKAGTLHVDLAGDTSDLKKSLQDAEKDLKGFDSKVSESVMSLGEMKREFRTLSKMSMVGKTPQEVEATTKRMAFLKDAIGDTNNTIKSLSLDPFQKLAETVQVGSTMMAGLAGATSLLGGEQEKMQELMEKTVALIALANAAQEAATFFQERSSGIWIKNKTIELAARIKEALTITTVTAASTAENAVKSKGNIITKAITASQWLWNAAVAANPIGLIIAGVAALGLGVGLLISKMSKSNSEFKNAAARANELKAAYDELTDANKFYIDSLRALGTNDKQISNERKQQIEIEMKVLEERLANLNKASLETRTFWTGLTKGAKDAKKEAEEVKKSLGELWREQQLITSASINENNDRTDQIKTKNDELRRSMLTGSAKEIADLYAGYQKDIANWSDSAETKKLIYQKYVKDLAEINKRLANEAKRKQEEEFLVQAVPKIISPETKDLYLKSKTEIPEQKIIAPVSLSFLVKKIDTKEIETSLIDVSDMLGSVVTQGLNDMAVGISETIGEMAAGNAGMDDLFQNMLSIIGDFLTSLGKSLIAAGIGAIAFESLLFTPGEAIIAGAALVALGAVVKAKLASGPSGSGSTYSSASTTSSSYDATGTRQLTGNGTLEVVVSGKLIGSGSDLQAVLDKEANRRSL